MQDCQPPKCNRNNSGECGYPNPWHIFQKLGLGKGMTDAQRKKAYKDFKKRVVDSTGGDLVAFRMELCRLMASEVASPPSSTSSGASSSTVVHHACDIPRKYVTFFDRLFPMNAQRTNLTLCELVGRGLLRQCLPLEEAQSHSFEKSLGVGLNGFVFSAIYRKRERRVVKMVMVGSPNDPPIRLDGRHSLHKVSERLLRSEWKMHKAFMSLASPNFRVLKIYGDPCVFKPPKYRERYRGCVGTYVMADLPFPTLDKQLKATTVPPPHWMEKIEVIPSVIAAIHRSGMAHSDLHVGNIAFDPRPSAREPPYVIDFGRALVLDAALPNKKEQSRFMVIEYTIPLDIFCRMEKPSRIASKMYNAFLKGIVRRDLAENLESFHANTKALLIELFTPLPTSSIAVSEDELGHLIDRREYLCDLVMNAKLFRSAKQSYLHVAAGDE
jgi:hypothetical protein